MKAKAMAIGSSVSARARGIGHQSAMALSLPGLRVTAGPTDISGAFKYLRVKPEEPQQLIWLVPKYGIDYQVESNTNWNIV